MFCPKCNSENVQIQAKKEKKPLVLGFMLACGGLGLMILGVIGAVCGIIIGIIVGIIVKAVCPESYNSIAVCQDCGHIVNIGSKNKKEG